MRRQYGEFTVVFNVKDIDRSKAFYRDVVGLDDQLAQMFARRDLQFQFVWTIFELFGCEFFI